MSDCHPFAEFILSEAEGLWASAYLVARNDDGKTKDMKLAIIGLDCATPQLVFERFLDDLPHISRLMAEGA